MLNMEGKRKKMKEKKREKDACVCMFDEDGLRLLCILGERGKNIELHGFIHEKMK